MSFAHVTNGTVDQIAGVLPTSWRMPDGSTVSGFNFADPATQQQGGWFPLVENHPALTATQVEGVPTFAVGASSVTATYPAVPMPASQQNANAIGSWLDTLITQGENAVANWATLTAAQKDAAAKQAIQAITRLARLTRANLSSPGA